MVPSCVTPRQTSYVSRAEGVAQDILQLFGRIEEGLVVTDRVFLPSYREDNFVDVRDVRGCEL